MLDVKIINNVKVASFNETNRLNLPIVNDVKKELNELLKQKNSKVILNLNGVKFIDSTGFGVLISALKTAKNNNSYFALSNINKDVYELVKLMQLQNIFNIYDDYKEACEKI